VYQELRRRAAAYLRRERVGHTLQPTALVNEVFLLLVKQDRTAWQNRAQFFGVASQMMRRLLVDRARARNMAKRSGRWARVTLDEEMAQGQAEVDVLDLDRALSALAAFDARKSQVAELRFSGGCRSKRPATCWASPSPRWSGSGRRPARGFTPVSPESHHDA
jgi:RNA polymerase sigma factor (TIGR02999 family)